MLKCILHRFCIDSDSCYKMLIIIVITREKFIVSQLQLPFTWIATYIVACSINTLCWSLGLKVKPRYSILPYKLSAFSRAVSYMLSVIERVLFFEYFKFWLFFFLFELYESVFLTLKLRRVISLLSCISVRMKKFHLKCLNIGVLKNTCCCCWFSGLVLI